MLTTRLKKHVTSLQPGDACGPYELVSTLGRGGYGTVYKAVHRDSAEEVALKVVLHGHAEDERAAERLILEAKAVRRVNHVNVIGYRDADRLPDGEGSWLALELVRGQTLGHILRRQGRLSLRTALHLGVQLCEGLAHIHEVPLVHRDIKPYNLMITKAGTLKIIDLGIVRTKRGAGTTRQVGSGYYSAPDYLRLSAEELEGTIDPRWDLYSAGVVLWEMLAGHHPLRSKGEELSLGAILAHYIKDRRLPRLSLPNLPDGVADVVEKAVAFDPDERWQSAAELGDALRQQMQRPPVPRRTQEGEQPPASAPSGTDPLSAQELAQFQQAEIQAEVALETARTKPLKLPSKRALLRRQSRTIPIDPPSGDSDTTDQATTAPMGGAVKALNDTAKMTLPSEEQTDPVLTAPLSSAIETLQRSAPAAKPNPAAAPVKTAAAPAKTAAAPIALAVAPVPPSIGPVLRGMKAPSPSPAEVASDTGPAQPPVIAMAPKPRAAPLEAQRVIVRAPEPPQQATEAAPQPAQAMAVHSLQPAAAAAPAEPTPFLQRQLSQRRFEVALTALIAIGGITLMLIVLRLLGVI